MQAHAIINQLADNISLVIKGQAATLRALLAAFATGGHILLEDFPGTGKTTLAKTLARSVDMTFQRIQFTPDLLPSDILGVSIFDQKLQEFRLHKGPIFTGILLADEINRASPRTQSALLEAMEERQISLDGTPHALDPLFMVIATQNPIEFHGTYPLPEAQMDRFAMRLQLGYLSAQEELELLTEHNLCHPLERLTACADRQSMQALREATPKIRVSDELKAYIVAIIAATRTAPGIQLGASPRASLTLMKTAQALALFDNSEFVTPDHIKELAATVIAHRLVLSSEAKFSGATGISAVTTILDDVPVPQ